MTFKRRNRGRKGIFSASASKGFQFISIIILLQSFPLSLSQNVDICAGKPFGAAIEDLTDCTGYFECIPDAQHTNCPSGQRFDVITESCIDGKCPPCKCEIVTTTNSPTTEPTPSSSESSTGLPISSDSSTSSETSTSEPTISTESSTTEVTSSAGTSTSPGAGCSNEPYCKASEHGTAHRDRKDCRKYYVCINGEAIAQTCNGGMYFDEDRQICNFPALVSCSPSTNDNCTPKPTESTSSAPSTGPTTVSSSSTSDISTPLSTEPSTPTDTSESSTSEPTTSTESSTTEVTSSAGTSTSPEAGCSNEPYCQASEHGTIHRDRKDCSKYYVCMNGEAIAQTCNGGMYFDEDRKICNIPGLVSCSPSTNDNCTPKPTESSSSAPSTGTTTVSSSSSSDTSTSEPSDTSISTTDSTSEPTTATKSSTTEVSSPAGTTHSPGSGCSNEPYCKASEHGTFHRDRKDCRKYYVCLNGDTIAHTCDGGMYFDEDRQICNYPSLVSCSPNTNENCTPKPTESSSSEPHTSSESSTSSSKSSTFEPTTLTESESTSTSSEPSTSSESSTSPTPTAECSTEPNCQSLPSGSFHRDKKDCRKYYVCLNGSPIPLYCASGQYFDDVAKVCNYESYVVCTSIDENCKPITQGVTPRTTSSTSSTSTTTTSTSKTTTTSTTTQVPPTTKQNCPSEPNCKVEPQGSVHRDPMNCAKFYVCKNGASIGLTCRNGEYFDLHINACQFSSLVDCKPSENCSSTPSTPTTPKTSSLKASVTQTTMVPNGHVDPNITDCKTLPNRSVFRHSIHCNVYYVCRNKMAVKHSCSDHQWFDSERMLCNFRNLVSCPSGMD